MLTLTLVEGRVGTDDYAVELDVGIFGCCVSVVVSCYFRYSLPD